MIGLGMSLYDLIATCEEIVKGNQVTDASKFLCDSASEIPEGKRKLKEQLDAMQYDVLFSNLLVLTEIHVSHDMHEQSVSMLKVLVTV